MAHQHLNWYLPVQRLQTMVAGDSNRFVHVHRATRFEFSSIIWHDAGANLSLREVFLFPACYLSILIHMIQFYLTHRNRSYSMDSW